MGKYDDIKLYPSTRFMQGRVSNEDEIEEVAQAIYDDLICGRRLRIEDVPKLLQVAIDLRESRMNAVKTPY